MIAHESTASPATAPGIHGAAALAPRGLIERYCTPQAVGDLADPISLHNVRVTRGWCGRGGEADPQIGSDDGHDFAEHLEAAGWRRLPTADPSPRVAFMVFARGDELALAEYREGELTVSERESATRLREHGNNPS